MSQTFDGVANFKIADAIIQVLVFMFLVLAPFFFQSLFVYSLAAMAGVQCLSTVHWSLYFATGVPQTKAGKRIRIIFLVTMALLFLCFCTQQGALIFVVLYLMIFIGPVLGLSYFIITLRETSFYRKARKPYYLL